MPSISAFPACCGAAILTGFTENPNDKAGYKIDPTTMGYAQDEKGELIPISFQDRFKADLEKYMKQYPGYMYTCILTQTQIDQSKDGWMVLLKACGFEFVRRWTNSVHNDAQYLYLFVLCTDQKGRCKGDFTQPPKGWEELPGPTQVEKPSTFQKLKDAVSVSKAT